MAVALAQHSQSTQEILPPWIICFTDWSDPLGTASKQSTAVEVPLSSAVPVPDTIVIARQEEVLDRNCEFEIAYHALGDRRGANATPAGRRASRKVWLDAGADAAKWLINRLRTEQHPEMIIGIAETITELGTMALPVALAELERYDEAKPEYAALVGALAWMALPPQPLLMLRIASIIDRYLASPHSDCQVAAVQLTRTLDDNEARARLNAAKQNTGQHLREEIEDLLSERFGE